MPPPSTISLRLTRAEAVVLLEFLAGMEDDAPWRSDSALSIVLNGIECDLEKEIHETFDGNYGEILDACNKEVVTRFFGPDLTL